MLDKVRGLFSRSGTSVGRAGWDGPDSGLDLEEIYVDLNELVAKNQVKLVENEHLIDKVELECKQEEEAFPDLDHAVAKRCSLRRIKSLRKRIKRMARCSTIYNDNITMHMHMADRLEDMRVSGLKTITPETLENIALDNEELYQKHRDLVHGMKAMEGLLDKPKDLENDPELRALAEELGL